MKTITSLLKRATHKVAPALALLFTLSAAAEWQGTGAEADPYVISTAAQLQELATKVNGAEAANYNAKYYKLGADITLTGEWTPIGNGSRAESSFTGNAFGGIFDGAGFQISGLSISAGTKDQAIGLFGVLNGGTVKNLTLSNVNINAPDNENAGGVAGLMVNGSTVDHITVSGSVTAMRGNGGIIGRMTKSGTISHCVNNAVITGAAANVGGIIGAAYYTEKGKVMTISNCENHGTVTGTSSVVGGIVAFSSAIITECTNDAAVTGNGPCVAGIVGEQQNYGSVSGCVNSGTVLDNSTATSSFGVGGIVGWIRYTGGEVNYPLYDVISVTNNRNTANVTGGASAGGIVGHVYHAANVTGNISTAAGISSVRFAAGIVGTYQNSEGVRLSNIPETALVVTGNASTTQFANIIVTGDNVNRALYVYDNTQGAEGVTISGNINELPKANVSGAQYATPEEAVSAAVTAATDSGTAEITLTATTEASATITEFVSAIAATESANISLTVPMANGTVSFNRAAVNGIKTKAGENAVAVSVEQKGTPTATAVKYTIELKVNGVAVATDFGTDGEATVTVAAPEGAKKVNVYYLPSESTRELVAGAVAVSNGKASFTTTHFSDYEVETVTDTPVASVKVGETTTEYTSLSDALDAAITAAKTADNNVTVEILDNIDLGNNWVSKYVNINSVITINGNDKTITGLNCPLISEYGGGKGLNFNNLTIFGSNITASQNNVSSNYDSAAAFIGYVESGVYVKFNQCEVSNCTITSSKKNWTGAFIGYVTTSGGHNVITFNTCRSVNNTIVDSYGGSVGGLIGHASGSNGVEVEVVGSTVSNNTVVSSDAKKAGALFGTIGAGNASASIDTTTVTGNKYKPSVTDEDTTCARIFGRYGSDGATVSIAGGTYDAAVLTPSDAPAGSSFTITGGTFTGGENLFSGESSNNLTVSGGIFSTAVPPAYCANGFAPMENGDGTYGVEPAQVPYPTAIVEDITDSNSFDPNTALYPNGWSGAKMPLTFAMRFTADTPTEQQLEKYGNWRADYVLTVNKDIKGDEGYLAGYYEGPGWICLTAEGSSEPVVRKDVPLYIMRDSELDPYLKYSEVVDRVKMFECGIYLTPDFLAANPDFEVKLELRIYDPTKEGIEEGYKGVLIQSSNGKDCSFIFNQEDVLVWYVAKNATTGLYYETLAAAVDAAENGETIKLLCDVSLSAGCSLNKAGNITIDGCGYAVEPSEYDWETWTGPDFDNAAVLTLGNGNTSGDKVAGTYAISNVVFRNFNQATENEARVISVAGVENVKLQDVTFENCILNPANGGEGEPLLSGSIVSVYNAGLEAEGVSFESWCSAAAMIAVGDDSKDATGSSLTMKNCQVTNSTALSSAIVYVRGASAKIENCEFIDNFVGCEDLSSEDDQFAMYRSDSTVQTYARGVIFFDRCADSLEVKGSTFSGNTLSGSDRCGTSFGIQRWLESDQLANAKKMVVSGNTFTGDNFVFWRWYLATKNAEGNVTGFITDQAITGTAISCVGDMELSDNTINAYDEGYGVFKYDLYSNAVKEDGTPNFYPYLGRYHYRSICSLAGTVKITSGYFGDEALVTDYVPNAGITAGKYLLSGGTFVQLASMPFESWSAITIADGFTAIRRDNVLDKNGNIRAYTYEIMKSVAKIGEQEYGTLAEAVAAAQNGEIVDLLADTDEEVAIENKAIVVKTNGHTWVAMNANMGILNVDGECCAVLNGYGYVAGDLEEAVKITARDSAFMQSISATEAQEIKDAFMDIYLCKSDIKLTDNINLSYHNCRGDVIFGNPNLNGNLAGMVIDLAGHSIVQSRNYGGGWNSAAIYTYAPMIIRDSVGGGKIDGADTGIIVDTFYGAYESYGYKPVILTIESGTITTRNIEEVTPPGNWAGAAVKFTCGKGNGNGGLIMTGGTLTCEKSAEDLSESIYMKGAIYLSGYCKQLSIEISGGEISVPGKPNIAKDSSNTTVAISGGTFSTEPDTSYIVDGYESVEIVEGTTWQVKVKTEEATLTITLAAGKEVPVAMPFGDGSVAWQNVLTNSGLPNGSTVKIPVAGGKYAGYQLALNGENKVWNCTTEGITAETVATGDAIWIALPESAGTPQSIALSGNVAVVEQPVIIKKGTNLVCFPTTSQVDVNATAIKWTDAVDTTNPHFMDRIEVIDIETGKERVLFYLGNGKWGENRYDQYGKPITSDTKLKPGQGFMYLRYGDDMPLPSTKVSK